MVRDAWYGHGGGSGGSGGGGGGSGGGGGGSVVDERVILDLPLTTTFDVGRGEAMWHEGTMVATPGSESRPERDTSRPTSQSPNNRNNRNNSNNYTQDNGTTDTGATTVAALTAVEGAPWFNLSSMTRQPSVGVLDGVHGSGGLSGLSGLSAGSAGGKNGNRRSAPPALSTSSMPFVDPQGKTR